MSQSVDHGVGIGGRTKDSGGEHPGEGERKGSRTAEAFQRMGKGSQFPIGQHKKVRLHNIVNDSVSVTHPDGSHYVY